MSKKQGTQKIGPDELAPGIKKASSEKRHIASNSLAEKDIRGIILFNSNTVENQLFGIQFTYFNQKLRDASFAIILIDKLLDTRFTGKINVVRKIFEHYFPDIPLRYPDLFKEIDFIRNVRNIIAHAPTVLSAEDDRMQFIRPFDVLGKDYFTLDDATEFRNICGKVIDEMWTIQNEIMYRTPGNGNDVKKDEQEK